MKLWGLATKITLSKNLHDSAWNLLWDFFNDTSDAACELTMLILSPSVTFSATCLTVASLITKSCQLPATLANTFLFILQGSALADLGYGGTF